jgi:hypothetical protein
MGLRVLQAVWWGVIWGAAGAVIGLYGGFGSSEQPGMALGAVVAGGVGFIYGLLLPGKATQPGEQAPRGRFGPASCAWCGGKGVIGRSRRSCQVCEGQGRVLAEQPARRCSRCKGKGRLSFGRRCNVCDGAGWSSYVLVDEAS